MPKAEQGIDIVIDNKNFTVSELMNHLDKAGKHFADSLKPESKVLNNFLEKKVKPIAKRGVKSRFTRGRDVNDKKWEPLGEFRKEQRERKGTGNRPLDDTGKLKRSIRYQVVKESFVMYSVSPYAWVHQQPITHNKVTVTYERGVKGMVQNDWKIGDVEKPLITDMFAFDVVEEKVFERAFIPQRTFLGFTPAALKSINVQMKKLIKRIVRNFLAGLSKTVSREVGV